MNKKRYAIVRVNNCPSKFEKGFNDYFVCDGRGKDTRLGADKINCEKCNYGDTKEQLIRKVAQALLIDEIERYRKAPNCDVNKTIIEHVYRICLEKAQFIVEFLGVTQ